MRTHCWSRIFWVPPPRRPSARAPPGLTAGRIASTEFELHGPLGTGGAAAAAHGSLELRDAAFAPLEAWPEVQGLSAHIEWQDARVRASVTGARSGALQLSAAHAEWDARGEQAMRVRARLSGSARAALEWLRARPELAAAAPGAAYLDVEGDTLLDVDLRRAGLGGAHQPPARTRIVALLDGVRVHALAGLPPLEALRGTLAFSAGHLQHSTLTGQWLGGPVSLAIGERRDSGATAVAISARGFLDVHQALVAASAEGADANLTGNTEWSALLTVLPQTDAQPLQWRVRADSNLLGVASRLPEPLAKAPNTPLPLRVEVQGQDADAQLHISLGERLQGLAALERSGDQLAHRTRRAAPRRQHTDAAGNGGAGARGPREPARSAGVSCPVAAGRHAHPCCRRSKRI